MLKDTGEKQILDAFQAWPSWFSMYLTTTLKTSLKGVTQQ